MFRELKQFTFGDNTASHKELLSLNYVVIFPPFYIHTDSFLSAYLLKERDLLSVHIS